MSECINDEFTDADFKDLRRSRRLSVLASSLADAPANSITAASGGWAECTDAFRFFSEGHYQCGEPMPHAGFYRQVFTPTWVVGVGGGAVEVWIGRRLPWADGGRFDRVGGGDDDGEVAI